LQLQTSCIFSHFVERCKRWGTRDRRPESRRPSYAVETPIEIQFRANGLRPTSQRRLIVAVISEVEGYLDFTHLYRRVAERNRRVSRATVYRTLKVLTAKGIIECHAFRDGRSRLRSLWGRTS
jgi:hypothetical protein